MANLRRSDARWRLRCAIAGLWACFCVTGPSCSGATGDDSFGFSALRDLIESRGLHTVEEVVAALPHDLRSHYTLVFSSRSLQGASYVAPRAILFGHTARFIVTFNGEATQRGYGALETMEFEASTSRFIFREVILTPRQNEAQALISPDNPSRCTACHGEPARPIWDGPNLWPGVYGERYLTALSAAESRGIRAFLSAQPTHPRYRYLMDAYALAGRDAYVPSAHALYNGPATEPANQRLFVLLSALNVRAVVAQLLVQPAFPAYRYALLAAAGGSCGPLSDFFPQGLREAIDAEYRQFLAMGVMVAERESRATQLRLVSSGAIAAAAAPQPGEVQARFIVELGLDLSTRYWSLALEPGAYGFATPTGALSLERVLLEPIAAGDQTVRNLALYRTSDARSAYCSYLSKASQHELQSWYATHATIATTSRRGLTTASAPSAATPSRPKLLQACIVCHNGDIGPALPFAQTALLAPRLLLGQYPRGRLLDEILYRLGPAAGQERMPRGVNATPQELQELSEYFLFVATQNP